MRRIWVLVLASMLLCSGQILAASRTATNKAAAFSEAQGLAAYQAKEFAKAASLLRDLTVRMPDNANVWLYYGLSLAQIGQAADATQALKTALELAQTGPIADRARQALDKAPGNPLRAIQVDPALTLEDWLLLANRDIEAGKAREVLKSIVTMQVKWPQVVELGQTRQKAIAALFPAGPIDDVSSAQEALAVIDDLGLTDSEFPEVSRVRARAKHFLGDYEAATAAYTLWLKYSDPDNPLHLEMLFGLHQARQQQLPEVIYSLPTIGLVLGNAASDGKANGDTSSTGAQIARVIPDSIADRSGLLKGDRVTALQGKSIQSSREFELLAEPIVASGGRAELLIDRRGLDSALRVALSPDELAGKAAYGKVEKWITAGEFTRAIGWLMGHLTTQTDDADAHYWLGVALAKSGDLPGGRTSLHRSLRLRPAGVYAEQARKFLQELPIADPATTVVGSGITLADWLRQVAHSMPSLEARVLSQEVDEFLVRFGAVPALLELQANLNQRKAEELSARIATIKSSAFMDSPDEARRVLESLRTVGDLVTSNYDLIFLQARACHVAGDFDCAMRGYQKWLTGGKIEDPRRGAALAAMGLARAGKEMPPSPRKTGELPPDCPSCPGLIAVSNGFVLGPVGVGGFVEQSGFAIMRTEVTQALWHDVMGTRPSKFSQCGAQCPVDSVSWDDARQFAEALSRKTGKVYRLPSAQEWLVACLAGGEYRYCGGDVPEELAWFGAYAAGTGTSARTTHPVAQRQPNRWGIYDMSGNVKEWVADLHIVEMSGTNGIQATGIKQSLRALRGGSWATPNGKLIASQPDWDDSSERYPYNGVRLVRELR